MLYEVITRRTAAAQQRSSDALNRQLRDSFNALAAEALKSNNAQFLRLAKENLEQFHIRAEGELAKREKAVENMVRPIREALVITSYSIHYTKLYEFPGQHAIADEMRLGG